MARAAADAGFEVRVAEPDQHTDMAMFTALVNSVDVMVGVHGAGLTNMVFLPRGAVLIQVVPFGGLEWLTSVTFKDPAADLEVSYMDYK
jgi:capsular polysaccharide biosynthesis protein